MAEKTTEHHHGTPHEFSYEPDLFDEIVRMQQHHANAYIDDFYNSFLEVPFEDPRSKANQFVKNPPRLQVPVLAPLIEPSTPVRGPSKTCPWPERITKPETAGGTSKNAIEIWPVRENGKIAPTGLHELS
jgi:hypothetical protein